MEKEAARHAEISGLKKAYTKFSPGRSIALGEDRVVRRRQVDTIGHGKLWLIAGANRKASQYGPGTENMSDELGLRIELELNLPRRGM